MRDATPQTIHLTDYTPPAYLISTVLLDVDIRGDEIAIVTGDDELLQTEPAERRNGDPNARCRRPREHTFTGPAGADEVC